MKAAAVLLQTGRQKDSMTNKCEQNINDDQQKQ